MLAAVLSQPSLPLNDPAGIEISPDDLDRVQKRLERDEHHSPRPIGFKGDKFCQGQRFAAYSEALGDRFVGRVFQTRPQTPTLRPSSRIRGDAT